MVRKVHRQRFNDDKKMDSQRRRKKEDVKDVEEEEEGNGKNCEHLFKSFMEISAPLLLIQFEIVFCFH